MEDSVLFHQTDCVLPRDVPWMFGIVYSLVWFGIFCFLVVRMSQLKKEHVRKFAYCTVVYHISLELLFLSTYVQEGFYELAAVFLTVCYVFILLLMTLIMVHMLQLSSKEKVENIYALMQVCIGVEIGLGILCSLFVRTEYFNLVLLTLLLTNQLFSSVATFMCYRYTNKLLMKMMKDEGEHSTLIQRVGGMQKNWIKLLGSVHVVPTIIVGLWIFYGYLPYQFVFCYGTLFVGTLSTIGLVSFFPHYLPPQVPTRKSSEEEMEE